MTPYTVTPGLCLPHKFMYPTWWYYQLQANKRYEFRVASSGMIPIPNFFKIYPAVELNNVDRWMNKHTQRDTVSPVCVHFVQRTHKNVNVKRKHTPERSTTERRPSKLVPSDTAPVLQFGSGTSSPSWPNILGVNTSLFLCSIQFYFSHSLLLCCKSHKRDILLLTAKAQLAARLPTVQATWVSLV
jgi:hypothetical protein